MSKKESIVVQTDSGAQLLSSEDYSAYIDILREQILFSIQEIDHIGYQEIHIRDLPDHMNDDMDSTRYLELIGLRLRELNSIDEEGLSTLRFDDLDRKAFFASFLCSVQLAQPTSSKDINDGLQMLRVAATHGDQRAICYYAPALAGTNNNQKFPSLLFLSLLAMAHSDWALEVLHSQYPSHYAIVRKTIRERSATWHRTKGSSDEMHSGFLLGTWIFYDDTTPSNKAPTTLTDAIEVGTVEDIRKLLKRSQCKLPGLLHVLVHRPDSEAAELCEEVYELGAKLEYLDKVDAAVDPSRETFPWLPSRMTALSAASKKGKRQLVSQILSLHRKHERPAIDFHCAIIITCGHLDYESALALLKFQCERPHLCFENSKPWEPTVDRLSMLLYVALDVDRTTNLNLERRAMLGASFSDARLNTLKLLLRKGANPFDGQLHESPIVAALRVDDVRVFSVFLEVLSKEDQSVLNRLNDTLSNGNSLSVGYLCIRYNSVLCFQLLLDKYSEYLQAYRGHEDATLLHTACEQPTRRAYTKSGPENGMFVRYMLLKGFNVLETTSDGFTPLYLALRAGNLLAADEISHYATFEQMQKLMLGTSNKPILVSLLTGWRQHRSQQMLKSIQWSLEHGGAQIDFSESSPLRIFADYCINGCRPSTRDGQILDRTLLRIMLERQEIISTLATEGTFLLMAAVRGAHIEVLELLAGRGVDINESFDLRKLWSKSTPDALSKIDFSPRDLARLTQCGHIPPEIAQGGYMEIQKWRKDVDEVAYLLAKPELNARSPAFEKMLQFNSLHDLQSIFARNFCDKDLTDRLYQKLSTIGQLKKQNEPSTFWPAPILQEESVQNKINSFGKDQQQWQDLRRMWQKHFDPQGKRISKERCDHRHAARCHVCDMAISYTLYKCLDCEDLGYCGACATSEAMRHPSHRVYIILCECRARSVRAINSVLNGWLREDNIEDSTSY
ncbi:hypothetical protein SLS60_008551 [Paraconiothyrium brasiliense]|uniref:Ankyrin repeat protein n=1 Tax=Paraconiothyrium brasiliense TaxID=300254 RepID=A0ABR3R1G7_9PLEO